MRKLIQAIVVALAVAGSVSGCAVTSGQESTGQYVDDATITSRVKTRFAKDPTVSAMRISVETMQGVVQLSGFAKNQAERDQAGQLARSVSGVKEVRNTIQVETASSDNANTNR